MELKTEDLVDDLFWFARVGDQARVLNILDTHLDALKLCDEQGCNILHMICANNNLDLLKFLKGKPDLPLLLNKPNLSGNNPIHWAVLNKHSQMVEYLVDIGADYKAINFNGDSPIDIALYNGDLKTIHLLENLFSQHDSLEV
jgi:ankyrin repeat protein